MPGGHREPDDRDTLDTALRETAEEADLVRPRTAAIGPLPLVWAARGRPERVPVRPWLLRADELDEPGDGDGEMEDWFWFRLRDLDDPELRRTVEPHPGQRLPGVAAGSGILWGMTLEILQGLWTGPLESPTHFWFDFDGTLYPASLPLVGELDRRITAWVSLARSVPWEEADRLRSDLYHRHGNTLNGMMREDDVDPHAYLDYVFDLPGSSLPGPDPLLDRILSELPGTSSILTNARADYVVRCLRSMGLERHFGRIHDIESFDWRAKPEPAVYREALERDGVDPAGLLFLDDRPENLAPARALGATAVLVDESDHHPWLWPGTSDLWRAPARWKLRSVHELPMLLRPRLGLPAPS